MTSSFDYIRDPGEIYRQSFAAIESACDFGELDAALIPVVTRMVHACGMVELPDRVEASRGAVSSAQAALAAGASVLCDVEMVRAGIIRRYLPNDNSVCCTLGDEKIPALAKQIGNTRSAAAVELWRDHLQNAVVVIGNAPTAMFRLLELLAEGAPKPALIIGIPVGFVGAVESKAMLATRDHGCEFITVHGRIGGSALAASCFNGISGGLNHA